MMITNGEMKLRLNMYSLLSRIYRVEVDEKLLNNMKTMSFPKVPEGCLNECYKILEEYLRKSDLQTLDNLAVDFASLFLAAGSADGAAAVPYESVYTSQKKILMQESWEEVTELFNEKNICPSDDYKDLMADHISLELEYMKYLIRENLIKEQEEFIAKHLLNWIPALVTDIEKYGKTDFYKAMGKITVEFLNMEKELITQLSSKELGTARSFSVREERFNLIVKRMEEKYRIFAPKRLSKRGTKGVDLIRYGEITSLSQIVYKEKTHFSPKEVFYPISQTMFKFSDDGCIEEELSDDRDIILIMRPCDINGLKRLDNIFINNGNPDYFYTRMREKLHIIMLECSESFDNCFCVSMGTNKAFDYSGAIRIDDICALVEIKEEKLLAYFDDEVSIEFSPEFIKENKRKADVPVIENRETLEKVCKSTYWDKYDDQCIGCGMCNTVCPTCSCFDTLDVIYNEGSKEGERRRVWSSCMLSEFTTTAGGGKARKTPGANMRFKVLHKMYDYNLRFKQNEQMCVGCGRCVDRCPKDIDYLDTVNGLSEQLKKEDF